MTAKWKQIESYVNFQPIHEIELTKFNITQDQARLILDLKKAELAKFKFLSMLDISKKEVKQLAKIDPTIVKAIGKQARKSIEELIQGEVYLELKVKVRSGWRNNESALDEFGYL